MIAIIFDRREAALEIGYRILDLIEPKLKKRKLKSEIKINNEKAINVDLYMLEDSATKYEIIS